MPMLFGVDPYAHGRARTPGFAGNEPDDELWDRYVALLSQGPSQDEALAPGPYRELRQRGFEPNPRRGRLFNAVKYFIDTQVPGTLEGNVRARQERTATGERRRNLQAQLLREMMEQDYREQMLGKQSRAFEAAEAERGRAAEERARSDAFRQWQKEEAGRRAEALQKHQERMAQIAASRAGGKTTLGDVALDYLPDLPEEERRKALRIKLGLEPRPREKAEWETLLEGMLGGGLEGVGGETPGALPPATPGRALPPESGFQLQRGTAAPAPGEPSIEDRFRRVYDQVASGQLGPSAPGLVRSHQGPAPALRPDREQLFQEAKRAVPGISDEQAWALVDEWMSGRAVPLTR